jgi:hypothetical protein
MKNHRVIYVDELTYERLRKHVYELHLSFGKVIAVLLDGYDAGDPRSTDEREQDAAAQDWADQTADLRGAM